MFCPQLLASALFPQPPGGKTAISAPSLRLHPAAFNGHHPPPVLSFHTMPMKRPQLKIIYGGIISF